MEVVRDVETLGRKEFMICVLWIEGRSIGYVARSTGYTDRQIRGFIHRNFHVARSQMTDETRQELLKIFQKQSRSDVQLHPSHFIVKPLRKVQTKAPKPEVKKEPADPKTKVGRKQIKDEAKAAKYQEKVDEENRLRREAGYAKRGDQVAALEQLERYLPDFGDRGVRDNARDGMSSGQRRMEAGRRLRKWLDGRRISGMKSIDYEAPQGGGGGGLPMSAFKLQCMHEVGELRQQMTDDEYLTLEAIVDNDAMVWENLKTREEKAEFYEAMRRLLDVVAVQARMMPHEAFLQRWGYRLNRVDHFGRRGARIVANLARELLASART